MNQSMCKANDVIAKLDDFVLKVQTADVQAPVFEAKIGTNRDLQQMNEYLKIRKNNIIDDFNDLRQKCKELKTDNREVYKENEGMKSDIKYYESNIEANEKIQELANCFSRKNLSAYQL